MLNIYDKQLKITYLNMEALEILYLYKDKNDNIHKSETEEKNRLTNKH